MGRILVNVSSLLLMATLGLVVGCGGGNNLSELNDSNIERLANLYHAFQKANNWEGPADEEEFKNFIRNYTPRKLKRIEVDPAKLDELFVSERDGEPFEIRYGVTGSMMGCSKPVVFESVGVGTRKMIGFLDMTQRQVEQEEYDDLLAGRGDDVQVRK